MSDEVQPQVIKGTISYKKLLMFAVAIALILGAIYLVDLWQTPDVRAPQLDPAAALGEAGAPCGGNNRLPCKPGNACMVTNKESRDGVCIKISDTPGTVTPAE